MGLHRHQNIGRLNAYDYIVKPVSYASFAFRLQRIIVHIGTKKVERIISSLYKYYIEHSDEIPGVYKQIEEEEGTEVAVKDLISGMTDRYALNLYDKLFVPQGWRQL